MSTLTQRKIVVGVGGGGNSLAAVDLAAAEADRRRLPLSLLRAHPDPDHAGPHSGLATMLRRVCTTWPGLAVAAQNVTGDPAEVLIDASRAANLVVVGGSDIRQRTGARPVPVWAQVGAHAHCPTLVVPAGRLTWQEGPVLLGVAMSGDDEPAIEFAFEEADLRRVPLLATHVWSGIPGSALGTVSPYAYDLYEARAVADRALAETLAGWADKYPDVRVERMPLYDADPARTLQDATGLASLVVVGARRHGRRSSQLIGTVTRALVAGGACPVAILRPGPHG
jgi:nucleotide-binding universal stress UspA family protein